MTFKEGIGDRIKAIRKAQGYTQESVINAFNEQNNGNPYINNEKVWQSWEAGRTMPNDYEVFAKICKLLGVSSDYLLDLDDEIKPGAKQFKEETGLSESAIANISRYKNSPVFMDCLNQFLSSAGFLEAIGNIVVAKSPSANINTTDDIKDKVSQGAKLHRIATGQKKVITDERITLAGERLKEWELWQASQNLNKVINRIVKGDTDDGTR